ncbi:MAG TPA: CopD family protein [Dermatophilaceae bacterium]|nr:CopD family protein [Dermatophilaceae bacterium]
MQLSPDFAVVEVLAVRWLGYLGLVMLLGTALFVSWIWPDGRSDRVLSRLLVVGGALSAVSTVALPLVSGAPGSTAWEGALAGRAGAMALGRLALFVLAVGFGPNVVSTARRYPVLVTGWCLAVVETYVIGSPAPAGPYAVATVVAATGHLLATATWLGGLLALSAVLLPRTSLDILDLVISRFSRVAVISVLVLSVTGAVHALATAGGLSPLLGSRYGAVLFVKVCVFAVMLVLGNQGRRYAVRLAHRRANPGVVAADTDIRVLAVAVGGEFALALGVLAVTAVLVQAGAAS